MSTKEKYEQTKLPMVPIRDVVIFPFTKVAFKIGRRELGHLHGDHGAHFAFPKDVWLELREQNRISEHPVFPGKPGPAARRIEDDTDVVDVIALLRINYDRIIASPTAAAEPETEGPGRPRELDYGPTAQ